MGAVATSQNDTKGSPSSTVAPVVADELAPIRDRLEQLHQQDRLDIGRMRFAAINAEARAAEKAKTQAALEQIQKDIDLNERTIGPGFLSSNKANAAKCIAFSQVLGAPVVKLTLNFDPKKPKDNWTLTILDKTGETSTVSFNRVFDVVARIATADRLVQEKKGRERIIRGGFHSTELTHKLTGLEDNSRLDGTSKKHDFGFVKALPNGQFKDIVLKRDEWAVADARARRVIGRELKPEPYSLQDNLKAKLQAIDGGTEPQSPSLNPKDRAQKDYLEELLALNDSPQNPRIVRGSDGYSLRLDGDLVLKQLRDGCFATINSTAKTKPLKLGARPAPIDLSSAIEFADLGIFDFVTERGLKLFGEKRQFCSRLFQKVESGVDILPDPEDPTGILAKEGPTDRDAEKVSILRTWGQEFLASRSPSKTEQGRIFAGGEETLAFFFPHWVIVESSFPKRATFILTHDAYEQYARIPMTRVELLARAEPGSVVRVIHPGDSSAFREQWCKEVEQFIARS